MHLRPTEPNLLAALYPGCSNRRLKLARTRQLTTKLRRTTKRSEFRAQNTVRTWHSRVRSRGDGGGIFDRNLHLQSQSAALRIQGRGMRPSDKWVNLADVLRVIEPALETKLLFCRNNPPDPVKQPVTSALVAAYISRVELELATIRRGAPGLLDQSRERPTLTEEIVQIESWILRRKSGVARRQLSDRDEQAIGDWFVSKMNYSYSETNQMLGEMRQLLSGKGAPNKRPETLKMLDARICNAWSYPELARRMCDCGSLTHTDHCEDRIRKRIRALEGFLIRYDIKFPNPAE